MKVLELEVTEGLKFIEKETGEEKEYTSYEVDFNGTKIKFIPRYKDDKKLLKYLLRNVPEV